MKILLVRLRQIGDVVFTTPTFAALKDRFPSAALTYVVEPAAAPVVEGNAELAAIVIAPRAGGFRGLVGDVARVNTDAVLDLIDQVRRIAS